jgi:hypothetical protein
MNMGGARVFILIWGGVRSKFVRIANGRDAGRKILGKFYLTNFTFDYIIIIENDNKSEKAGKRMRTKLVKTTACVLLASAMVGSVAPNALAASLSANSAINSSSQHQPVVLSQEDVERFAEQFFTEEKLKAWNVPGAVISVVQNNKTIYQAGFGTADLAAQTAADAS